MRTNLICHFWNEELLLPYYIRQNRPHFDHAVFLDYDSTDASTEIIRALWPEAEIRTSRNRIFDAPRVDEEVMDVERELSGWKLALNVTEMLFLPDFREALTAALVLWPERDGFALCPIVMVDPLTGGPPLDPTLPLYAQRHHGWIDPRQTARSYRYVHRRSCGDYTPGRHSVPWRYELPPTFYHQWWGWSPLPETEARKLNIQQRMPPHDVHGNWHVMNEATFHERWAEMNRWAEDMRQHAEYQQALQSTCRAQTVVPTFPFYES
jgi:hypothetical protein